MARRRKLVQPHPYRAEVVVVGTAPDGTRTYEQRYPCAELDCHMTWHTTPRCPNRNIWGPRTQYAWTAPDRIMAKVQHQQAVRASAAYTDRQHRWHLVIAIVSIAALTALMIASNYM